MAYENILVENPRRGRPHHTEPAAGAQRLCDNLIRELT